MEASMEPEEKPEKEPEEEPVELLTFPWNGTKIIPLPNAMLQARFPNGITKLYDAKHIVRAAEDKGVRKIDEFFSKVSCSGLMVYWDDTLNITLDDLWTNGKEIPAKANQMTDKENAAAQKKEDQFFASRQLTQGWCWEYLDLRHSRKYGHWLLRRYADEARIEIWDLTWKDGYTFYLIMPNITLRGETDDLFGVVPELERLVGAVKE